MSSEESSPRFAEVVVSPTQEIGEPSELQVDVALTAPSGRLSFARAVFDGDESWRARFEPDEVGRWFFAWTSSPRVDGIEGRTGTLDWSDEPVLRAR